MENNAIDTISSGLLGRRAVTWHETADATGEKYRVVLKRKNSLVVPLGAVALSPSLGVFLRAISAHRVFGFNNGQRREKLFYENVDEKLRRNLPHFLGAKETFGGQNVTIIMEELPRGRSADYGDLRKIIDVITDFHAVYYDKRESVEWMKLNHYTPRDYRRARGTLRSLFRYYYDENVKLYGKRLAKTMVEFIENVDKEYAEVMDCQTLTHNDLTPRNIAICDGKVILYDWELACFQNPEHDLVELLFTTVDDNCTSEQICETVKYFRTQTDERTGRKMSDAKFAKTLRFNALEYCVNRLAIYRAYSKKHPSEMAKRCERNMRKVLEVCV